MLLENGTINLCGRRACCALCHKDYRIYYDGFLYLPYTQAGNASLCAFVDSGALSAIQEHCARLYGNYWVVFENTRTGEIVAFCDHNGMGRLYICDGVISNSFLDLCDRSKSMLDMCALEEFVLLGGLRNSTLVSGISRFPYDAVAQVVNGELKLLEKTLAPLEVPSGLDIEGFFDSLAMALPEDGLAVDLTGGTDSRLAAVELNARKKSYLSCISGQKGIRDVTISETVADALNKRWFYYEHTTKAISECELIDLFEACDGSASLLSLHRIYEYSKALKVLGVRVKLKSIAGELFKDSWWQHEIPFYRSEKSDLAKLYHLRINPIRLNPGYFTPEFYKNAIDLERKFIEYLECFAMSWNTKTYDHVFYRYFVPALASTYMIEENAFYQSYSPLCEYDLVRYAFSLPRKDRTMARLHRKAISMHNKAAARLKTTTGESLSDVWTAIAADHLRFVVFGFKRLATLVLRKVLRKTYFLQSADADIISTCEKLPIYQKALEYAVKAGVLQSVAALKNARSELKSRVFSVGMLLMYLEKDDVFANDDKIHEGGSP